MFASPITPRSFVCASHPRSFHVRAFALYRSPAIPPIVSPCRGGLRVLLICRLRDKDRGRPYIVFVHIVPIVQALRIRVGSSLIALGTACAADM